MTSNGAAQARANGPKAKRVVLITIDGFRIEMLRDKDMPSPVLKEMAAEGVLAERVVSVAPAITAANCASTLKRNCCVSTFVFVAYAGIAYGYGFAATMSSLNAESNIMAGMIMVFGAFGIRNFGGRRFSLAFRSLMW